MTGFAWASAASIAAAVRRGEATASLERIERRDAVLNAFTAVTADRALTRAATAPQGPLAGVPFAVKNLIDIAGLPTLAGSKINREHPPARADHHRGVRGQPKHAGDSEIENLQPSRTIEEEVGGFDV